MNANGPGKKSGKEVIVTETVIGIVTGMKSKSAPSGRNETMWARKASCHLVLQSALSYALSCDLLCVR